MWSNLAVFRGPDPTAGGFLGGFLVGLENRGEEGSVSMRSRGAVSGSVEAVWDAPDGRFLGTLEAVLGHAEALRAPPLHEKMHVLVCTLLESFRPPTRAQVAEPFLYLATVDALPVTLLNHAPCHSLIEVGVFAFRSTFFGRACASNREGRMRRQDVCRILMPSDLRRQCC